MGSWWSSLPNLIRVNNWSQIAIIICTVGLAVATPLAWWTGRRIEDLRQRVGTQVANRLAETQTELQITHAELEETRRRFAPRTLTPAQRQILLDTLRREPKGEVKITSVLGDSEAYSFATELQAVLGNAGWTTQGVHPLIFSGNPVGLTLILHSSEHVPSRADHLVHALREAGLAIPATINSTIPNEPLMLRV